MLLTFVVLPGHTAGWGWKLSVLPATTLATLVLIHGSFTESLATRLLGWGFLRAVGLRAYSLYMWHMTIMWLVWVNFPTMPAYLQALAVVALATPVTILSFRYLERPFMRSLPHAYLDVEGGVDTGTSVPETSPRRPPDTRDVTVFGVSLLTSRRDRGV